MGIDRGAGEEPDPPSGASPSSADAPDPAGDVTSPRTPPGPRQQGGEQPCSEQPRSAPEYDYGAPDAGAADDTAVPDGPAGPGGPAGSGGPAHPVDAAGTDPGSATPPASELHPETGLRPGTAPRAVLRPVPDGFPTPPPRPARPNRRPAPKTDPEQPSRWRPAVIISVAVVAVLVLVVAIGGSIIVYRALSPDSSDAASPAATAEEPGAGGEVAIADVTVREVSTESGVREVGGPGSGAQEPEGEFVVVTVEVTNDSDSSVSIDGRETLRTADGKTHEADSEASGKYVSESVAFGKIAPGESGTFHLVYDVPVGAEPTELELDFSENAAVGAGVLPLGG